MNYLEKKGNKRKKELDWFIGHVNNDSSSILLAE
jgi:hypothetical protein